MNRYEQVYEVFGLALTGTEWNTWLGLLIFVYATFHWLMGWKL